MVGACPAGSGCSARRAGAKTTRVRANERRVSKHALLASFIPHSAAAHSLHPSLTSQGMLRAHRHLALRCGQALHGPHLPQLVVSIAVRATAPPPLPPPHFPPSSSSCGRSSPSACSRPHCRAASPPHSSLSRRHHPSTLDRPPTHSIHPSPHRSCDKITDTSLSNVAKYCTALTDLELG